MNKKIILLIVVVLVSMLFISGCAQIQDSVKSGTVTNIATTAKDKIQSTAGTLLGVGKGIVAGIK